MAEAQQTSDYPGSLDTWVTLTDKEDLAEVSDINKIKAAIEATQTELGADVAGSATNLLTRLAKILADSGAIKQGTSFPGITESGLLFFRTDLDKFYIRNAANDAWDEIGAGVDYDDGTTYTEVLAGTERSRSNIAYGKMKELSPLQRAGVVTITWQHKIGGGGQSGHTKLYINDVAVGTEQGITNTAYENETEAAVSVSANDKIQIYGKTADGAHTVYVDELALKCLNPTVPQEAT
jgi:hypothetical protein